MKLEKRIEKFTRKFQRLLTEDESKFRFESTRLVARQLYEDSKWKDWITGGIIFGSLARNQARTGSDVDLAILTKQHSFFGMDYSFVTHELREGIINIQKNLELNSFEINPQIVAEKWIRDPQNSGISDPAVIESILKEGIKII